MERIAYMRKLRGLFVTNDVGNFGASRSLSFLLKNLTNISIDLVVPKLIGKEFCETHLRERFGPNVNRITRYYLPFDYCHKLRSPDGPFEILQKLKNTMLWLVNRASFWKYATSGRFDFVHLNSLVLHRMISPRIPCFLHVREIYEPRYGNAARFAKKAAGLFFIDAAAKTAFPALPVPSVVLHNPFDMTELSTGKILPAVIPGIDAVANVVFSLIGNFSEQRGADFIISAFREVKNARARLIVVGTASPSYLEQCRQLAKDDSRIYFLGERSDICSVYLVSDYVLRGEPFHCLGRTIYEGLYAGCGAIIPGNPSNRTSIFDHDLFSENIFLYPPRDKVALTGLMEQIMLRTKPVRRFRANVEEHAAKFTEFIYSSLNEREYLVNKKMNR